MSAEQKFPKGLIRDLLTASDLLSKEWRARNAEVGKRLYGYAEELSANTPAPPAPSVADAAVIDYGAFYAQDMDRRLAKLDVGPQIADAAGASEGQEPVAWAAVHFGGKRNGEIYSTSATKEQIDAYIDQVHQSSDSLTLSARPIAFADAAPPAPSVADAKCMCSGLGPCEKLSNCRKAPSVADAAGASETITLDMVRDAAFGAGLTLFQWDRLKFELKDAIAKESGND